jgi:hypothetical protein
MNDEPGLGSVVGFILAGLAILAVVMLAVWGIAFGFRWFTAAPKGKLQAREQIQSGDNRIQAYNHFFDLCASVQTLDQALNQSYDQLKTATTSDDKTRIETNIGAQLNSRNDAANQYDADSHKSYTVGQFKASSLPYSIAPYEKGQVATCTY